MKFSAASRLALIIAAAAMISLTGCSVAEGPTVATDPNAKPLIMGQEPEHAPIPQKNVPEGESSLSHKNPDQRIDQPKG